MSAGIVYEGVVPQDGRGGTVFKDIKFWVAHRVPSRKDIVQNIESNGGIVVRLEKNADYLIADHARNDAPPGSYSWKFIEDTLQDGIMPPMEKYLCANPQVRPVGSTVPSKGTRRAFTPQDDQILVAWVKKHAQMGSGISGNTIYQDLALKYPHHTWQSWRSRYMQTVKLLNLPIDPTIIPDENSALPTSSPAEGISHKAVSLKAPKQTAKYAPVSGGRTYFTEEDDKALLAYMVHCQEENKPLTGNKIYEDFAQDFPRHPAQSWRNRWVKILKPKLESGVYEGSSVNSPRQRRPASASRSLKKVISRDVPDEEPLFVQEPQEEAIDGDDDNNRQQQTSATQTSAAKPPMQSQESREPDPPVSRSQTPDQPLDEIMVERRSPSSSSIGEPDLRTQFNKDYQDFTDSFELQPQWWPTIRGKTFELWDLWQAVQSQKVEPEERDWRQISEDLGFNWVEHETIPDVIRQYYEEHLLEFENLVTSFDAMLDGNDGEGTQRTQANAHPEGALLPSSPPGLPTLKRSYDKALSADHNYPHSSPKRPRLDPRSEVPSTPDEKNGTSHPRRETISGPLPSGTRSPDLGSHSVALRPPAQRRIAEPETQDFRFDPETQAASLETQESVTPSQQLLLESDARSAAAAATPTPARIRPVRSPFLDDESDSRDVPNVSSTTKHRSYTRMSTEANSPGPSTARYRTRTLPRSFALSQAAAEKRAVLSPARQQAPPSTAPPIVQKEAQRQPTPRARAKESPEDIIEFYMSLGYEYDDVVRALDATSWVPGLASQVMEMLKGGESLPSNWRGVWTQKDDESLRAVLADDDGAAQGVKERRKREKKQGKLENKHTREGIDMRIRFLEKRGQ